MLTTTKQQRMENVQTATNNDYRQLDPDDRIAQLKNDCVEMVSNFQYDVTLTESELAERNAILVQHDIELEKVQAEKKEVTSQYNQQIKDINAERRPLMETIKTGKETVIGDVYLVDDQAAGIMRYINGNGEPVFQRPLLDTEKQLRIESKTNDD